MVSFEEYISAQKVILQYQFEQNLARIEAQIQAKKVTPIPTGGL
jgi:hypothetical protein